MGCAGEKGQVDICWSHVETVSTFLGILYNMTFLLLGLNILTLLRAYAEKPYKETG